MTAWPIYTGSGVPHHGVDRLPAPPNWRSFDGSPVMPSPDTPDSAARRRLGALPEGTVRVPDPQEVQMVNAALFLRRPLLVTGRPGTGKSSLAALIAQELSLGPLLRWPITSRSTLADGLYRYDAIGRLREENVRHLRRVAGASADGTPATDGAGSGRDEYAAEAADIGRHLRLGPLGTALLPYARPRVLLVDEIDKSDVDLPNDLLNVFEEGEFEIDELSRLPEGTGPVTVNTADRDGTADVVGGRVRCRAFPLVVLTSNGERQFPAAFLRRCLRLDLQQPGDEQLDAIVTAHLGREAADAAAEHVGAFLARRERSEVTTDQLLNAVYLATSGSRHEDRTPEEAASLEAVVQAVMRPLTGSE
ncbi:dynein-related subfamily AAA family protein [Streptomyces sp. T12]|uniref:AAA family ATPase n=1 Tax=Streptomyces sp. T12 TaxID=477697 RepID=UPI0011A1A4BA|nr:MoxR family ATPase [Streptomyces sp. T12]TWD13141.1 dynein-related subfamily AAA family protein [Streptomyces sp. T12]